MKIAAMGAGGVGGYFGARLQQGGHDVAFFARGKHLEAIRRNGLTIESALAEGTCVSLDFPHFRTDARPQRAVTARTTELVAG